MMHSLTNVDYKTKTAICSVCGPVSIIVFGGNRQCINKHRELQRAASKRRAQKLRTLTGLEPGQRKYGTQAHLLSEIDDVQKTAMCSVCGFVKIYVFKHENYTTRRCSKANSKNVMVATRKRQEANRLFINKYKIERGCQRCGYNTSPIGLDLHHRNPAEKDIKVTEAMKYSRARLLQELEKCDVLCAICHRVVHHELGHVYK